MRNLWTIERDTLFSWEAALPESDPDGLLAWRRLALSSGDELGVYRIERIWQLGFDRRAHGPLQDWLDANPDLDPGIGVFGLEHEVSSRLTVIDADGAVTEQEVADLAAILARSPSGSPLSHHPPLTVFSSPSDRIGPALVSISSWSDVWLPWCSARYGPMGHPEDIADNTALAYRHTPRLNTWLDHLRTDCLRRGGQWSLDRGDTARDRLFELDDRGVRLEAGPRHVRSYEEPATGPGAAGLLDALRAAARMLAVDPAPPGHDVVLRASVYDPDSGLYRAGRATVLEALRRPGHGATSLGIDDLRGVAEIEVDNLLDRHGFSVAELLE